MIENNGKRYEINSLTALVKLHEFIQENPIEVDADAPGPVNDDAEFDYDLLHDCEHGYDRIYKEYVEGLNEDPYEGREYNIDEE